MTSRTTNPKAAWLIFQSGKIVCAGTSPIDGLTTSLVLTSEILRRVELDVPEESDVSVQNFVRSGGFGTPLDLNAIAIKFWLEAVECEPEQFSGLVYRPDEVDVVVLLFGSGKLVIIGGSQTTDTEDAVTEVHSRLDDLGLLNLRPRVSGMFFE